MIVILTLWAMVAPGTQCDAVAQVWEPAWRGAAVTRGCDDRALGA